MARPSSSGDGRGADRSRPVDREEQRSREGGRACRKPGGCSARLRQRPTLCSENERRPDSSICTDERLIGTCSDIAATEAPTNSVPHARFGDCPPPNVSTKDWPLARLHFRSAPAG